MYKSRFKDGISYFRDMKKVDWSKATQQQMKEVYERGDNDYVYIVEDAKPKKKQTKVKSKSKDKSES